MTRQNDLRVDGILLKSLDEARLTKVPVSKVNNYLGNNTVFWRNFI